MGKEHQSFKFPKYVDFVHALDKETISKVANKFPHVQEIDVSGIINSLLEAMIDRLITHETFTLDNVVSIRTLPRRRHSARHRKFYDSVHTYALLSVYYQCLTSKFKEYVYELQWDTDLTTKTSHTHMKIATWIAAWKRYLTSKGKSESQILDHIREGTEGLLTDEQIVKYYKHRKLSNYLRY